MHNLLRTQLNIGEHALDARIARTPEQRALGLQHRQEMGENEAMLFVCGRREVQKFWMKDTPVPLSIAFLGDDVTILHLDDLEPLSLEVSSSRHSVLYILEVLQGWFDTPGIQLGPVYLDSQYLLIIAVTVALVIFNFWFFEHTLLGKKLQATSQDK